jgi:dTMP kinase
VAASSISKGRFIVFEGIEAAGKSTQSRILYETARKDNDRVILTDEPSSSKITRLIRRDLFVRDNPMDIRTLQFLFLADRSYHVENTINPRLAAGDMVLCDRFCPSGIVYGAAFGSDYKIDLRYMMLVHSCFPQPDAIFYIDVPAEVAVKRLAKRKGKPERFDKLDKLRALRKTYKLLAEQYSPTVWHEIDGNRTKEEVTSDIMQIWGSIVNPRR